MIALSRAQRGALLFVSASAYLAWYSGLGEPLEAQGIARGSTTTLALIPHGEPGRLATLIRRDPFSGAPVTATPEDRPLFATAPTAPRPNLPSNETVANLAVPDIATRDGAPEVGSAQLLVVRATIVGSNPVAYVANGSMMDIVRIGDRLGDRRIGTIDLRGIAFTDGSRLDLPDAFVAPPRAPARTPATVTIKLEDLRKLVLRPRAQSPPLAPGAGLRGAPQVLPLVAIPAPTGTFPSPGPLPTIDARGIPVGTNPTPDANGPTPYPNPYPYAPPAPPHR